MSGTVPTGDPARNPPSTGNSPSLPGSTQQAKETVRDVAQQVGSHASATANQLRDEVTGTYSDIKAEGAEVAAAAKERAIGFAEEQQQMGAERAEGLARAVHGAADQLQETSPEIARYVQEAASAVDGFARTLRTSSPGELMGHVEDLARRQPVAFFGAAVLAGFALARFAKSSAQEHRSMEHGAGYPMPAQRAIGGGMATPHSSATGAPGWVPASPGRPDDAAPPARPATMAAASLGGAAARPAGATGPGGFHGDGT